MNQGKILQLGKELPSVHNGGGPNCRKEKSKSGVRDEYSPVVAVSQTLSGWPRSREIERCYRANNGGG